MEESEMIKIRHVGMVIKSHTNGGDLCKTRYCLIGTAREDAAIFIDRLILSSDKIYMIYALPLKTFKDKTLYNQIIAIKLGTFNLINHWLKTMEADKMLK